MKVPPILVGGDFFYSLVRQRRARLKAGATEFADNWFSWERAADRTRETLTSDVNLS
jgi:hypothetical protein